MNQSPRVNWVEAKTLYVSDSRNSYQKIASIYGVSKSTIQKRGTKDKWTRARKRKVNLGVDKILASQGYTDFNDADERHMKEYRKLQAIGNQWVVKAHEHMQAGDVEVSVKSLLSAARAIDTAIKGERAILLGKTHNQQQLKSKSFKEEYQDILRSPEYKEMLDKTRKNT